MHHLDPDYLPKTVGTLDRFVLNPKADVDGLLLSDGTEIHTPPHLSAQLIKQLKPGASLTVYGVKTRSNDLVIAIAIDPANGTRIVDHGPGPKYEKPHKPREDAKPVTHSGVIQRLLHGPKGNLHGALLDDGTVIRFPPHSAKHFADFLAIDAPLSVRGNALTTGQGTVIDAKAMGREVATLIDAPKPPKPPEHHDKHHDKHPEKKPKKGLPHTDHASHP